MRSEADQRRLTSVNTSLIISIKLSKKVALWCVIISNKVALACARNGENELQKSLFISNAKQQKFHNVNSCSQNLPNSIIQLVS